MSDGKASELGVLNFEFLLRQAAKPSEELFSASPAILNYLVVNYSRQGKHRRLWRLAVATHTTYSRNANQSRVIRNFVSPCPEGTRIYQKPTASSEGAQLWDKRHLILSWFRKAGPTIILNIIRDASVPSSGNPQLILNQLAVQGCVATARRHSLLRLPFSAVQFE